MWGEDTNGVIRRRINVSSVRQKCEWWVIQPKSEPSLFFQPLSFNAVLFFISPEFCLALLESILLFLSFLFFFSSISECTQIKVICVQMCHSLSCAQKPSLSVFMYILLLLPSFQYKETRLILWIPLCQYVNKLCGCDQYQLSLFASTGLTLNQF